MMDDVDRDSITRLVYQRLADPKFRERLRARAADGTRPVQVCLPTDTMESLIHNVQAVGGEANVAVPYLNGIVVLNFKADGVPDAPDIRRLARDCTIGVFLALLHMDGGEAVYRFVLEEADHRDSGQAEMVALAG